ncbi:MAG: YtxH domain-containing protein [Bacteroidetes bacterium]|nr:MAG: YtxH domain-containing protein [Bacteroidota bacterium]
MADNNDDTNKSSFLIGFLAGGVIGAVIALLYAPKPGKELRADIRTKAGEVAENAEEYVSAARHKAIDIINEGKRKSEGLITEAKKRAESLLGDAEKILTDAKVKGTASETGKGEKHRS